MTPAQGKPYEMVDEKELKFAIDCLQDDEHVDCAETLLRLKVERDAFREVAIRQCNLDCACNAHEETKVCLEECAKEVDAEVKALLVRDSEKKAGEGK
jgi:hypothetical protein